MSNDVYRDGVLVESWDDTTRVYSWFGANSGSRAYTTAENTAADARAALQLLVSNEATIRDRVAAALQTNKDYIALATPTAAQTTAEVKALARQMNGVIRVLFRALDSAD